MCAPSKVFLYIFNHLKINSNKDQLNIYLLNILGRNIAELSSLNYYLPAFFLGKKWTRVFSHRDDDGRSRIARQRVAVTRVRTAGVVAARLSRRKRRGTAGSSVRSRHCARVRPSVRAPVSLPVLRYAGFTHPHSAPRGDRTRLRMGRVYLRATVNDQRQIGIAMSVIAAATRGGGWQ